jgi:mRNA interferase MazF
MILKGLLVTRYRGDIWLVNLNPIKKNNEMGKIRAVVVFQNNELNQHDYPTTIIVPLSTVLVDDAEPIRMRIVKRENLKEDSDLVITQIRAIDNDRFIEKLGKLNKQEIEKLKELFDEIVGI